MPVGKRGISYFEVLDITQECDACMVEFLAGFGSTPVWHTEGMDDIGY